MTGRQRRVIHPQSPIARQTRGVLDIAEYVQAQSEFARGKPLEWDVAVQVAASILGSLILDEISGGRSEEGLGA